MKYLNYKENRKHGTFNFRISFFHESPRSLRYYMPYHWHPEFEIIKIISGTFPMTIESTFYEFHTGDVIFIQSGFLHGGQPSDCIYEGIVFDMSLLLKDNHICSKTIQDIIYNNIQVQCYLNQQSSRITPLIDLIFNCFYDHKKGYEFFVQGYLYCLIGVIINERLYQESPTYLADARNIQSMKSVLEYIDLHYQEEIHLSELSKLAGMNPKYFCRYFQTLTGRTPIDYVNNYRIESACEQLATKNISIKEAALSCGFNNESYFIKTFRKYKQLTPKQYLKSVIS